VTRTQFPGAPHPMDDAEIGEMLRWLDTLDRI
jgi:hypothetical protein